MGRKKLDVIIADNIRQLLAQANNIVLRPEEIVSIQEVGKEYILIYYK